jgi:hypothetical protein
MGLIDLKTDLKSLRYGKDRLGGGSSNQPYIKSKIPTNEGDLGAKGGPDFLLRGGLLTPGRILKDTSRLTQMFFDFRSPNGLLFTAKQNVLSLTNVNSFAGEDQPVTSGGRGIFGAIGSFIKNNISLNQGVYLPTSTILGAAGNPLGIHLNKQGLDPTKRTGPDSGKKDLFGVLGITDPLGLPLYTDTNSFNERIHKETKSRLVGFLNTRQNSSNSPLNLYSYRGGPGSILGVGKTTIYLSKDRTGDNNIISNELIKESNTFVLSGEQISNIYTNDDFKSSRYNPTIKENFIESILGAPKYLKTDYSLNNRIEQRINLGNPGKKQKDDRVALDIINYRQIYKTDQNVVNVPQVNDLVKFRIGVIDNEEPTKKTNIHFRAFIDSMDDSYTADWQAQKFMGRGENFYRYNGFDRTVSLSWTVVAQSKAELIPMYQKLNYLASVCAPDYSNKGYMRGNLIKLTIGGYLYEQVGIMKGINYTVPQESPWEIGIPYGSSEGGTPLRVASDSNVKELPHMIKVTGFQFIPIHDFVPSVQRNRFGANNSGELTKYGNERYIALDNGIKVNYDTKTNLKPIVFPLTSTLPRPSIQPFPTSTPLST